MSVEDRSVTMKAKFRVYEEDGVLRLLNLANGEAEALDLNEVYLEFESNYRIGAQIIAWDGDSCREQFN
ncbi:MAG: hypothetical protein APF81_17770 [Desulfosporosinus sp. BRH_c37]|nr:MAG: hypothetical protein APF81_17770 [Desulfosporosinus sp. BRH_c37]